jgi:hypothetical protein
MQLMERHIEMQLSGVANSTCIDHESKVWHWKNAFLQSLNTTQSEARYI